MQQRILVQPQLIIGSYRQEGAPIYSVMCKNTHQVLRRRDSQGFHKDDISEEDSGPAYKVTMVKLVPGHNVVVIPFKVGIECFVLCCVSNSLLASFLACILILDKEKLDI